jgi:hypothetical protein
VEIELHTAPKKQRKDIKLTGFYIESQLEAGVLFSAHASMAPLVLLREEGI